MSKYHINCHYIREGRTIFLNTIIVFISFLLSILLIKTTSFAAGTANEAVNLAVSQIGYHEKASPNNLDDFTANSGSNNYTKYARELGIANGNAWCATFV